MIGSPSQTISSQVDLSDSESSSLNLDHWDSLHRPATLRYDLSESESYTLNLDDWESFTDQQLSGMT